MITVRSAKSSPGISSANKMMLLRITEAKPTQCMQELLWTTHKFIMTSKFRKIPLATQLPIIKKTKASQRKFIKTRTERRNMWATPPTIFTARWGWETEWIRRKPFQESLLKLQEKVKGITNNCTPHNPSIEVNTQEEGLRACKITILASTIFKLGRTSRNLTLWWKETENLGSAMWRIKTTRK